MSLPLNILWFLLGGFAVFFAYLIGGIIPVPYHHRNPFRDPVFQAVHPRSGAVWQGNTRYRTTRRRAGHDYEYNLDHIAGLELALFHLFMAFVLAITIIGLPFAAQHLKMTRLAILPFGFQVHHAD